MKECKDCGISKPKKAEFHTYIIKSTGNTGYRNRCIACVNFYRREDYKGNDTAREAAYERKKKYRIAVREALHKIYSEASCMDCELDDIRVLEFDHREDEEKEAHVSTLVRNGVSWDTIQAEIDKCDVVCANCHRIRTETRNPTYRTLLG